MEEENDEKRDFKRNLTAYVYQLKLLILMLWRGFDNIKINEFKLGTELKEGEIKWDDALFFCKQNGKDSVRYLQAKHSTNDNMKLKYEDFVGYKARIDLKKHFISFRKIKQKTWKEEIIDLVLCTNIPLDSLTLTLNRANALSFNEVSAVKNDDIFYDNKTRNPWKKYQLEDFINGTTKCAQLERKMKSATNLKLLANEFVVCLFNEGVKLDLSTFWISSFLNTLLEEEVIEMIGEAVKFSLKFIQNTPNLSTEAKRFRQIFMEACELQILESLKEQKLFVSSMSKRFDLNIHGETYVATEIINHIFDRKVQLNDVSALPFLTKTGTNIYEFSKGFTHINNTKNASFRKIFVHMYAEKLLTNKEFKFKQYSFDGALEQIANDLKAGYAAANFACEKCIRYHSPKINGMLEALNGSVFLATEDKHKISFNQSFFKSNGTSVNPFANSFFKHLQNAFGIDFTKIKDYEIEYYNYPPHFKELKDNGNIEDDIKEFIELFCIVNSPNETDLMDEVSAELGEHFNLLDADLMTFDLFQKILNWAKKNEDKPLTAEDVEEYKKHWNKKLAKEFEAGCTIQYCQKLKDFPFEYDSIMDTVTEFLEVSSEGPNNKQLIYLETDTLVLTSIKLLQTLTNHFEEKDTRSVTLENSTKRYEKINRYIFNPLSVLLRMSKYVTDAFSSNMNPLIIVDKETKTEADIKNFAGRIRQILQNNPEKKVIVITNNLTKFNSMHQNVQYEKCKIENVAFKDLKSDSQNKLLETSKVIFQGKEIILNELMDKKEDARELIDSKTMEDLITLKPVIIGEPVKTFTPVEEELYRPRKLHLNEVKKEVFEDKKLKNSHKFIIESNNIADLKQFMNCKICDIQCLVFMTSKHTESNNKKLMEKHSDHFIHWLKFENEKLIWLNSYVPLNETLPEEFKKYVEMAHHYVDEDYFLNYIKENRALIITDSAGMGKSYVITKFLKIIEDEKIWKIRINLNQYTATLNEIKKKLVDDKNKTLNLDFADFDIQTKDFGKLILKSLLNKNEPKIKTLTFENRMFNYFYMKHKMLIVFDGFDEIVPNYEKEVMALFSKLRNNKQKKIWITSRTNCKMQLEEDFNTFSYNLEPFNEEDQRIYLTRFWLNKWKEKEGCEMPNQHLLKIYVNKLIKDASITIKEILGIPLQTKIFAEIFQKNEKKEENKTENNDKTECENKFNEREKISWPSCFDYVLSDGKEELDFTTKLKNIFMVYKYFIKKKIYNYFLHEKGIVDLEKPFAKKIKKDVYRNEHDAHKIFGTISLCDETLCNKIISESEKKIKKHWLKNFRARAENIGIIDDINADGHPRFNHFTYGEYFAACYLIEKLMDNPSSAKDVFEIADEILKRDVTVFAQCFKHLLKQNIINKNLLNGDTVLQFCARNGFVNCVNLFINSKDFNDNFPYPDGKNKTILYYAAESQNLNCLLFLILYYYRFFTAEYELTFLPFLSSFLDEVDNSKRCDIMNDIKMTAEKFPQPKTDFSFPFNKKLYEEILKKENYVVKSSLFITQPFKRNIYRGKLLKHFSFENIKEIINFMSFNFKYVNYFFKSIFESNKTDTEKKQLFEYFVDNAPDENQEVIQAFIGYAGEYESVELLKNTSKEIHQLEDKNLIQVFERACRCNTAAAVKPLLIHVKDIKWPFNFSILHNALNENSSFEIIKEIIDAEGTDVDVDVNENGETALFTAIKYENNTKIIEYLISKGANPNKKNKKNKSPWTLAVGNAYNEIIRCLMNLSVDDSMLKSIREYFETPESYQEEKLKSWIECAVKEGNIEWCKFLLLNGGDEYITDFGEKMKHYRFCGYNEDNSIPMKVFEALTNDRQKNIPWYRHKKFRNRKMMETLIINAMKNYKDAEENTLLHLAVKHKNAEILHFLLNNGFSCNVRNDCEEIPTELSEFSYTLKDVSENSDKKLISTSTYDRKFHEVYEVYVTDEYQQTLLHHAVLENNIEAAEILINYGADINDKNRDNETPLSLAVKKNNIKMVKILLQNPIIFDTGLYDNLPVNESSKFLSNVRKCLYFALNENTEAFKENVDNFWDITDFNIVVGAEMLCGKKSKINMKSYIFRNNEMLIHFLINGINIGLLITKQIEDEDGENKDDEFIYIFQSLMGNSKSDTVLRNLRTIAEYIYSKKIDSKSIINFCDQNFMQYFVSFTKNKETANKIFANAKFQIDDCQLTLLQIAKKVNDDIIVEWLINEKGATE